MARSTTIAVLGCPQFLFLFLFLLTNVAFGQNPYRWNRTLAGGGQLLGARSTVTVTAQGNTVNNDSGRVTTGHDFLFVQRERDISRPALGGGGGGGGDSGEMFPNTLDGEDGNHADPVDGDDGRPGNAFSGQGGNAGANGWADASGTTLCELALSPDGQQVFSYSFIHNQWGDLDLVGGDGGGGGGGGSTFVDKMTFESFVGGEGGRGGNGQQARGRVVCTQRSDVLATAVCEDMRVPPSAPPPVRNVEIDIVIGWVSAANPDWIDQTWNPVTQVWERRVQFNIAVNATKITIFGCPTGTITAWGQDDLNNPFFYTGTDNLEGDTGSFGLWQGDIGTTQITAGQNATISSPINGIDSRLFGDMTAFHGIGGEGSASGGGGNGGGGAAGAGGINDETPEFWIIGGNDGSPGETGEEIVEHKDGIFEGWIDILIL